MPDSSSGVGTSKYNKIPKKLSPSEREQGYLMWKSRLIFLQPPPSPPTSQLPPPPPPQASPKAEPLSWAQRLAASSSQVPGATVSSPPQASPKAASRLIPMLVQDSKETFKNSLRDKIFEVFEKQNKKVVLYFHGVDGTNLHAFLSSLEGDNIAVALPRKGEKASITIEHRVDNDTVKKLIEEIAETTFKTSDGIGGCCYIDGDCRESYQLPNQEGVSESTIECKSNGKTNARRLRGLLN